MVTFISLLNGSSSDDEDGSSASSPSKIQAPMAAYKRTIERTRKDCKKLIIYRLFPLCNKQD